MGMLIALNIVLQKINWLANSKLLSYSNAKIYELTAEGNPDAMIKTTESNSESPSNNATAKAKRGEITNLNITTLLISRRFFFIFIRDN